ncbi:hypothetical protein PGSY75_1228900 [Plasmodium gaboni]|uniref:Uncharacterized protein n=1 Tax=Plasmodium gaboni TaxID=647221 RepID=A0A151LGI8_9APIC|nr:hypothetical protein PGSY75_1228900 [Plasmodium gaboni]KYN98090.1 hypothetical protein PGSY75_1228900 [Plasmodium gaboni]
MMNVINNHIIKYNNLHKLRKAFFYSRVVINNFEIKNNENLLLNNVQIIKDEQLLLNNCINFLSNFEKFAIICCACTDPKNKVQLKKSIWFSSIGLELKDFLNYLNKDNQELKNEKIKIFEEIIKLECPVILKDKNTVLIETAISPKKIVNSSKRMRHFFNISEIITCRSCYQKNKCKRFLQKYAGEPDFSDFTRLMIGFYNMCKVYTKRKESDRKELRNTIEKVNYFHFALMYMYNYLLKHKHFNYTNVEEGNKKSILKLLKEKRRQTNLIKTKGEQEKVLNIPKEYSDLIIPTNKANMKRKQKNVFEKIQKYRKKSDISEDQEKFIWVEEDDEADKDTNINCNKIEDPSYNINNNVLNNNNECHNLIEINNSADELPTFRFKYVSKKEDNNIMNYNIIYNKYTKMMEKKVYVNLDDQQIDEDIIKTENMLFKIPEAIGGYTFINYIENVPNNYIFPINKNLYEGIHVYKKEEINISHLWKNLHKEYLKIRKVNFFNTFNIKNSLNLLRHNKNRNAHDQQKEEKNDDIIELKDDLTSFEEYICNQKKEKNKQIKKDKYKKLKEYVSTYNSCDDKIKDDEDERFEYFKKLKNQNEGCEENIELKDQINSVYNNIDIEDEEGRFYKHTYNIRRKLNEEQNDAKGVTVADIQEEKKSLIENHKKELRERSYYICKHVKFPELKKNEGANKIKNRNKILKDELEKYIKPTKRDKKTNISYGLKEDTIKAHSLHKGADSLKHFIKKEKKKSYKKNEKMSEENI